MREPPTRHGRERDDHTVLLSSRRHLGHDIWPLAESSCAETHLTIGGRRITAVGVVLGQGQGSDTSELIAAAGQAAQQLVDSIARRTARARSPRFARPVADDETLAAMPTRIYMLPGRRSAPNCCQQQSLRAGRNDRA